MQISSGKVTFFVITVLFLLVVGCFIIETASVPILAPIFCVMANQFGIDPVQFGVVFVLLVCVGSLTPPVGSMLFVASKVGETPITDIIKNLWPFLIAITRRSNPDDRVPADHHLPARTGKLKGAINSRSSPCRSGFP